MGPGPSSSRDLSRNPPLADTGLVLLSWHGTRPFRRSSPVRTRFRRPRRAPLAAVPMGYSTGRCRSVRRRAKNKSGPARPRRTTSKGCWTYGPGTGRLGLAWGCRRRRRRWIPTAHALLPSAPAVDLRRNGGCQDIGRSPTAVPGGVRGGASSGAGTGMPPPSPGSACGTDRCGVNFF